MWQVLEVGLVVQYAQFAIASLCVLSAWVAGNSSVCRSCACAESFFDSPRQSMPALDGAPPSSEAEAQLLEAFHAATTPNSLMPGTAQPAQADLQADADDVQSPVASPSGLDDVLQASQPEVESAAAVTPAHLADTQQPTESPPEDVTPPALQATSIASEPESMHASADEGDIPSLVAEHAAAAAIEHGHSLTMASLSDEAVQALADSPVVAALGSTTPTDIGTSQEQVDSLVQTLVSHEELAPHELADSLLSEAPGQPELAGSPAAAISHHAPDSNGWEVLDDAGPPSQTPTPKVHQP